eukprot:TRINITY_DN81086_c0_g1_i1.p1 TRINITY_DN81086_c0_g1~~TRINITY_DN81086_c0_g1_i1.p1  ORF type:complete len:221 (+),score=33.04 TRINITY_DN81086_c0_g1_i1:49-711(+)
MAALQMQPRRLVVLWIICCQLPPSVGAMVRWPQQLLSSVPSLLQETLAGGDANGTAGNAGVANASVNASNGTNASGVNTTTKRGPPWMKKGGNDTNASAEEAAAEAREDRSTAENNTAYSPGAFGAVTTASGSNRTIDSFVSALPNQTSEVPANLLPKAPPELNESAVLVTDSGAQEPPAVNISPTVIVVNETQPQAEQNGTDAGASAGPVHIPAPAVDG